MSSRKVPKAALAEARASTVKFDARRNEIIDLAAGLFARSSYAATGVAEISEAASLGKGGLYYYIGSKETLLVEIHERVMQPLMNVTNRIAALEADPLVRLCLVSESLLLVATERNDHVRVFLHEHRALKGDQLQQFRNRRREYEDVITRLFAEGVKVGMFEAEDLRLTTLGFLGMHNSVYQWIRPNGRLTPLEISRVYCRAFFHGVATDRVDLGAIEDAVAELRPVLDGAFSA